MGFKKGQTTSATNALIPIFFFAAICIAVLIGLMLQPSQEPMKDCKADFACFSSALATCERSSYKFDDGNLIVVASIENSSLRKGEKCLVSYRIKDYYCPGGMESKECQAISMMRAVALKMGMECWLGADDAISMHDAGSSITKASFLGTCQGDLKEYVPILTGNRLH